MISSSRATDADSAHNLTIDGNRNAADQGREVFECRHYCPAFATRINQLFKKARRFLEHDCSFGFADGDVGSGRECAIKPLQRHQVAAVVDHGNDAARCLQFLRLRFCCSDDLLRALQGEGLLFGGLRLRKTCDAQNHA